MAARAALLLGAPAASVGLALQAADPEDLSPSAFERHLEDPARWTLPGLASGNPKLQSCGGERFQIHLAGDYTLLTAPDVGRPHGGDKLKVTARFKRLDPSADACMLFMKRVVVAGSWLHDQRLTFRAQDDKYDFAMRKDSTGKRGSWIPFANLSGLDEQVIFTDERSTMSISLKAVVGKHEARRLDIRGPFEHRFVLRLGWEDQTVKSPVVEISQPSPGRQFLNVKVEHLRSLNVGTFGGLLGDDGAAAAPRARTVCTDPTSQGRAAELLALSGGSSRASAHLD